MAALLERITRAVRAHNIGRVNNIAIQLKYNTMQSPGYTSLPGGWPQERRQSVVTWGAYVIPAVPLSCCLLIIAGLPMWAAGMLQARSTTDAIFGNMGVAADSVERLKVTVLTVVLLLSPLVVAVLACNVWLEAGRAARPETGLSLSRYTSHSTKVNAANWVLLLLLASVALSGSITWLTVMNGALSATAGGGGGPPAPPWWPPAAAAAAAAPPPPPPPTAAAVKPAGFSSAADSPDGPEAGDPHAAAAAAPAAEPTAATTGASQRASLSTCPPGCIDMGAVAALFGLPGGCFCNTWLLADLNAQLQQAVRSLSVAVAGAVLLLVGQSLLFGYLAGAAVHAARDLQELLGQGDGLLVVGGASPAAAAATAASSAVV